MERDTIDVDTFIGRLMQPTMLQGFKRIRYYGVQATKTYAKVKGVIQAALAKVEGVVQGDDRLACDVDDRDTARVMASPWMRL